MNAAFYIFPVSVILRFLICRILSLRGSMKWFIFFSCWQAAFQKKLHQNLFGSSLLMQKSCELSQDTELTPFPGVQILHSVLKLVLALRLVSGPICCLIVQIFGFEQLQIVRSCPHICMGLFIWIKFVYCFLSFRIP